MRTNLIKILAALALSATATTPVAITAKSPYPFEKRKGDAEKYSWEYGTNPFAENVFIIGYIKIENPVIIEYEKNSGSQADDERKQWILNMFVTSLDCLPENFDENIVQNSRNVYVLSYNGDIFSRFLWSAGLDYDNFGWNDPNYNNEWENGYGENCCKYDNWIKISDRIKLMRFHKEPICFLLGLVNSNYYNQRILDSYSGFIKTDGPVQNYIRVVSPVCCITDSANMPEILPWCVKENIRALRYKKKPSTE